MKVKHSLELGDVNGMTAEDLINVLTSVPKSAKLSTWAHEGDYNQSGYATMDVEWEDEL
jgi:hypothetical protein